MSYSVVWCGVVQCSVAVEFICIFVAALGTRKETRAVLRCAALDVSFVCVYFLVWKLPRFHGSFHQLARKKNNSAPDPYGVVPVGFMSTADVLLL